MHELPITESVLAIVIETAKQNGGGRVTAINLVIGEMTSVVDDSVQFYFDILGKNTLADGATLNFCREPATATCLDCQHQTDVKPPIIPICPNCGSSKLVVSGGTEFFIESIEMEDGNENDPSG
jgi:hydrogenase nickel incorporation protein HypA/HybF